MACPARAEALREGPGNPKETFQAIITYFHVVERLGKLAALQDWSYNERLNWFRERKRALKSQPIEEIEAAVLSLTYAAPDTRDTEVEYWRRDSRTGHSVCRVAG